MDVTLRDLGYFVALADEQHLTDAAKRLNIAPATLSEAIKRLEKAIDVNLFVRGGRRMVLSPDGMALRRHAVRVLSAADEFTSAAASRGDSGRPILRLGTNGGYGSTWVLRASEEIEEVEVQLLATGLGDPTGGLAAGEVDVAIMIGPSDLDGDLETRPLGSDERLAVLASAHKLTARTWVGLADLDAVGWLDLPSSDEVSGRYWRAEFERPGPPPIITRPCRTNQDVALAVIMGEGVCMMPRRSGSPRRARRADDTSDRRSATGLGSPGSPADDCSASWHRPPVRPGR